MNPNHDPVLAEMQQAAQARLTEILTDAQAAVRQAARLIASIPGPYRQNGMRAATDTITKRLDDADALFVEAFKSIHQTYGGAPAGAGTGTVRLAEPGEGILTTGTPFSPHLPETTCEAGTGRLSA